MPPWISYGIPGRSLGKHEQHFQSVPARRRVDCSLWCWPTFMYSVFHMRGECASPDSMSVGHKGEALRLSVSVEWGVKWGLNLQFFSRDAKSHLKESLRCSLRLNVKPKLTKTMILMVQNTKYQNDVLKYKPYQHQETLKSLFLRLNLLKAY